MSEFVKVEFEGLDEALKVLEAYPINAHKIVDKALRKGCTEAVREIRNNLPHKSWSKTTRARLKSYKDGVTFVKFGLFGKTPKGKKLFEFNKAYWYRYGTLSNRDPSHRFKYKRKPKTWKYPQGGTANFKGGIKPRNFYDGPADVAMNKLVDRFQADMKKQTDEIYNTKTTHARTTSTDIF